MLGNYLHVMSIFLDFLRYKCTHFLPTCELEEEQELRSKQKLIEYDF